jgi:plastin-1
MIQNSLNLGVPSIVRPVDVTSGNVKINTIFVAEIFNHRHGLEELNEEEKEAFEKFGIQDDDIEGAKDERAFRMWINSLNLEDVYIDDLTSEVSDGLALLKVLTRLDPSCIDWKIIDKKPNNTYKMGINCGEVIKGCKKIGLKIPGIGGADINKGNKKLILAMVWQMVRMHYLQIIGNQSEDQLVQWANSMVPDQQIKNLKDQSLSDGQFLIKLCSAIEPRAIDWDIVMKGETDEEKENNAKYIISISRKLGAVIFSVWEDISKVNFKMMLILLASLFEIHQQNKQQQ